MLHTYIEEGSVKKKSVSNMSRKEGGRVKGWRERGGSGRDHNTLVELSLSKVHAIISPVCLLLLFCFVYCLLLFLLLFVVMFTACIK